MLELTNKRSTYDVKGSSDTLAIVGQVSITPASIIDNFTGQFKNANDEFVGNFIYSELNNGKITKTLSEMANGLDADAFALLSEAIAEIKAKISE